MYVSNRKIDSKCQTNIKGLKDTDSSRTSTPTIFYFILFMS